MVQFLSHDELMNQQEKLRITPRTMLAADSENAWQKKGIG
jgi:hypothetical protein